MKHAKNLLPTLLTAFVLAAAGAAAAESGNVLQELQKQAEAGGAREQCDYAIACELEGDSTEAFRWFHKAAEQGLKEAQHQLGFAYANGIGTQENPEKALQWYRKAARQGYPDSQFELAMAYAEGRGIAADYRKAVSWFQKGADQGHPPSQCGLGWMYLDGAGVPQNHAQAYFWFNVATAQLSGENRDTCLEARDEAAEMISTEQLSEAQRLAVEYLAGEGGSAPLVSDDEPGSWEQGETPEEAEHRRQLELEQMRLQHQEKMQARQLRTLREIEQSRYRSIRRFDRRGRYR